ncbi:MAG: hypothetical protein E7631_02235 [Ruminococcaceae bacterium]|nr:hypothetical protein [Oscillospiraceae bacterium]
MNLRETTEQNPMKDDWAKDMKEKVRIPLLTKTARRTRTITTRVCRLMVVLMALVMVVSLSGCRAEENLPETDTAEETADPSWRFKDRFAAKQACLNALDLLHHIKSYDSDAMEEYRAYQAEIREMLYDDNTPQAQYEALYPQILERASNLSLQRGDTARVYISSVSSKIGHSYSPCIMGFVPAEGEEGEEMTFRGCEIRVRGNSTAGGPKFPYSFKLPYNESLYGMDAGKRWCLLANMGDYSLIRGRIGFTLAEALGCPYTPQGTFVEVYLNGTYLGNYELVEAISDAENRVDVDTDANEMILEADSNRDDGSYYIRTEKLGVRFKVDRPEKISSTQKRYLHTFIEEMEEALKEDSDRYRDYIDVDSFVNVYLTLEYTKNLDSNAFSTRYFIKDDKLYAGPVWDFDLSSGNVCPHVDEEGYRIYLNIKGRGDDSGDSSRGLWNRENWFKALFEHEDFAEAVAKRYREMRPLLENVYADNELGTSLIGRLQEQFGASFRRNYEVWDIYQRYIPYQMDPGMSYDEHVQFLYDWFRDRLAYLDTIYME